MNDSLTAKFQANPVIRRGLLNPKCVTAMQMLQQSPKEAQQRFAGDAEVEQFMVEFSRIMADHFTELGNKAGGSGGGSAAVDSKAPPAPLIQPVERTANNPTPVPIGPLHQDALAKSK